MADITPKNITGAEIGNLSGTITNYSVKSILTDAGEGLEEFRWNNTRAAQYLGYYKQIPELGSAIDAMARWVVGKGYEADDKTKKLLKSIKGWGKDSFNTIIQNMVRTYMIQGDAFAEIIKDGRGRIINLKPLDSQRMTIVTNKQGMLKGYEYDIGLNKAEKFKPEEIFHLSWHRVENEIHGISIIEKIENIILMRNEAMNDLKTVFHRYVKPLWIWQLDTDDPTKIAAFKAKADMTVAKSENIYIPQGAAEAERVSVPQYSTLDPLPWIENLTQYFYQATNIPDVILGTAKQTVEASAKILYLAFEQSVEEHQLFLEENIEMQLDIELEYEFPATIQNELMEDEKSDGGVDNENKETKVDMKGDK